MKRMPVGPYPVQIWLCLTEKSWNTYVKSIGYSEPVPQDLASVTSFEAPESGRLSMVVHLDTEFLRLTQHERIGIVVHEATHLWQGILGFIGETAPGVEIEAHAIQWLVTWLLSELRNEGWIK